MVTALVLMYHNVCCTSLNEEEKGEGVTAAARNTSTYVCLGITLLYLNIHEACVVLTYRILNVAEATMMLRAVTNYIAEQTIGITESR